MTCYKSWDFADVRQYRAWIQASQTNRYLTKLCFSICLSGTIYPIDPISLIVVSLLNRLLRSRTLPIVSPGNNRNIVEWGCLCSCYRCHDSTAYFLFKQLVLTAMPACQNNYLITLAYYSLEVEHRAVRNYEI